MSKKIGVLTIGQSPRVDMTPEMIPFLSENIEILEMGALDSLTHEELESLAPTQNQTTLVTRLNNGGFVKVAEEAILQKLQEKIHKLQSLGAKTVILACTGSFPSFNSKIPILYPDKVLYHVTQGILPMGKLGVIIPLPEQVDHMLEKWCREGLVLEFAASSPYEDGSHLDAAAVYLKEKHVDVIVLDCMGYNQKMKRKVQQITGKPVILSRNIVARVAAELL